MLKKFNKHIKNEKGLTLIELLAVIVILAIIAAIAIPAIGNIINKQRDKAVLANAELIINGAKLAIVDGACSADDVCTGDVLLSFVEGIALVEADTVTKSGSEYTLIWTAEGHDFKIIKEAEEIKAGATEAEILEWMGK